VFRIVPLFYVMLAAWLAHSSAQVSRSEILLNLTFLFPLIPEKIESLVPAGWSLGVEWIFYFSFPIFALLSRSVIVSVIALAGLMLLAIASESLTVSLNYPKSYATMSALHCMMFFQAGTVAYALLQYKTPKFSGS
jgi:peptidoglycan/LPS O-acetylase OafA/YrhL